ncbi:MAG: alpha-1,2-fucosyltransferase [Blastochloris sp.]|nr:alpha-1,2-fucosyltransferase [Blastochloris sp.]
MSAIIIRLSGGLGNQMFQYATGRALALRDQSLLFVDLEAYKTYKLHKYSLHHFPLQLDMLAGYDSRHFRKQPKWFDPVLLQLGRSKVPPELLKSAVHVVSEPTFGYQSGIFQLTPPLYLDGYWQSPRYFEEIADILRKEFQVKTPANQINLEMADLIQSGASVSLHIRRADYFANSKTQSIHGLCSLAYYKTAVAYLSERHDNLKFYIFSDDIPWAKENLNFEIEKTFIDFNDPEKNYEDLRLMSYCHHHIIANSTFSWWGAWLGQKSGQIVIAPSKWIEKADRGPSSGDILPDHWIQLD